MRVQELIYTIQRWIYSRIGGNTTYVQNSYGVLRLWKDYSTWTVRVQGYFRSSSDIPTSTVIFQIPQGYRPGGNRNTPMMLTLNNNVASAYTGTIDTEGNVKQSLSNSVRSGIIIDEYTFVE